MARSSKSNAISLRKQPATRRARKAKGRKKRGATLSKSPGPSSAKSTSRPVGRYESPLGVSNPQARRPISLAPGDEGVADEVRGSQQAPSSRPRLSSPTERPVAHSVKPRSNRAHEERKGPSSLALATGALLLGGALWFGLREREPVSTDATASEPAMVADDARPQPATAALSTPSVIDTTEQPSIGSEPEPAAAAAQLPARVAPPARRALQHGAGAEELEPGTASAPFDPDAVNRALSAAADQASACREAGDPTGVAKVVVTFAPSGRVTSATIGGPPFAGTPTGSCIAKTMRAMRLPPFEGDYRTVSKTVVIM